jgi:hypothetical protein
MIHTGRLDFSFQTIRIDRARSKAYEALLKPGNEALVPLQDKSADILCANMRGEIELTFEKDK